MEELKGVKFKTFEDLTKLLTPLIAQLVRTKGFIPPLDVTLVDSLNHLVVGMEMNAQGVFRNIADREAPLTATLPITATVTDSRSQTWVQAAPRVLTARPTQHFTSRILLPSHPPFSHQELRTCAPDADDRLRFHLLANGRPTRYTGCSQDCCTPRAGHSWPQIAKQLGIGVGTAYRAHQELSKNLKVESLSRIPVSMPVAPD